MFFKTNKGWSKEPAFLFLKNVISIYCNIQIWYFESKCLTYSTLGQVACPSAIIIAGGSILSMPTTISVVAISPPRFRIDFDLGTLNTRTMKWSKFYYFTLVLYWRGIASRNGLLTVQDTFLSGGEQNNSKTTTTTCDVEKSLNDDTDLPRSSLYVRRNQNPSLRHERKGLFIKGTRHIHTLSEKLPLVKSLGRPGYGLLICIFVIRKSQLCKVRLIVPACQPGWEEMENLRGNLRGNNSEWSQAGRKPHNWCHLVAWLQFWCWWWHPLYHQGRYQIYITFWTRIKNLFCIFLLRSVVVNDVASGPG